MTPPTAADAALQGPPFEFRLRVYWEDTDAGGVVFYALGKPPPKH